MEDEEKTLFEQRLAAIQAMPEGEMKQQAIADLSRDYEGRKDVLGTEYAQAQTDLDAAFDMPETRQSAPGNPFSVAIAPSALQYAAKGLRGYDAMKRGREAKTGLEALSEGQEAGLGAVMGAGAQKAMANQLRQPMAGGFGTGGLSPEDEEKMRRIRAGLM